MYQEIQNYIDNLPVDISDNRKTFIQPLIDYIQSKVDANEAIRLNLICTHNSRRSHLSQVWAQTMAYYYHIPNVNCYSGGTESTAVFPSVIETLKDTGFKIHTISDGNNPMYTVRYDINEPVILCFSKKYDDNFNPTSAYGAVLTCSQVDEACPVIFGAEQRISLPFEDPKKFDNTPEQELKYAERSQQIATEMKYVFSNIKLLRT